MYNFLKNSNKACRYENALRMAEPSERISGQEGADT